MGLNINTNIPALGAQRQANQANGLLSNALRQLSSGLRINRASDDAAGLAIADRFNSLIRQAQSESSNLQSGISAVQTAEGGLQAQQDAAQRLRELAVQAGNGTLSDEQRQAINTEAQQLIGEIGDTAQQTQFNGQNLLNQNTTIDLGTEGGAEVAINASSVNALGLDTVDLSTQAGAAAAVNTIDTALGRISTNRSHLGAQQSRFESAINQRGISVVNNTAAESRIRDLDVALGSINRARSGLLLQAGIAGLVQSNVTPQSALRLLGQ